MFVLKMFQINERKVCIIDLCWYYLGQNALVCKFVNIGYVSITNINHLFLKFLACSSELQSQRSQPLKKKINKKNAKQRIVPLDPLSEVPQPKGFPDGPPPRPSDPIDNLNLEGTGTIFMIRDHYR
jgi:hypothetical protein